MAENTVLTQTFHNPNNGRHYLLEVIREDWVGDTVVARYYGSNRYITAHRDINEALAIANAVFLSRQKRGYRFYGPHLPQDASAYLVPDYVNKYSVGSSGIALVREVSAAPVPAFDDSYNIRSPLVRIPVNVNTYSGRT